MADRSTHLGIVVGVDGSRGSTIAVEWAAHDAALREVPLTLVHAARTRSQRQRGQEVLDQARQTVGTGIRIRCEMPCATPVFALADLSEHADLVVVGCPGSGATPEYQLCSVSSTLVHHAHCPVVVIHDDVQLSPESLAAPVLVGVDGSPEAELAMEIAVFEASSRGVGLIAVRACQDPDGLDETLAAIAGWTDRHPDITVEQVPALADPAPEMVEHATKAQLVVVSSQITSGFAVTGVPIIVVRTSPARART
ncbi:hypothetical protein AO501_15950 [Mycobacterium gordonae]|uniref:UspA domain-containing protein n=1 Tax=Mycobacterium gordonae TaxID=1778 RepID=A0A0Q2R903_MYCGO|nr:MULTISPECIES: universal stress protein [Mycobacterium]KQH80486.1 hypothetical protein AO501_15950 [Mycobacterium gordonae]MDP7727877.1 universal stress protein [Mycobacterium sp. TY813]